MAGRGDLLPFRIFDLLIDFLRSLSSFAQLIKGARRYSRSFIGRSCISVSSSQSHETILTLRSRRAVRTRKTSNQYAPVRLRSTTCRTHCHILLKVLLAANKMRDLRRHIVRNGASVHGDPFPNLFRGALLAEVAGYRYGEAFQWLFAHR